MYLFPYNTGPRVENIMFDFERAAWSAVKHVFPATHRQGCTFHYSQALMKRIRHEGLAADFTSDPGSRDILKKMMALCYAPPQWIPRLFKNLEEKCTTTNMIAFAVYMRGAWIDNTMWPPTLWSAYNVLTRTNNHLEGWHREFNSR